MSAQTLQYDTLGFKVYFEQNSSTVNINYRDNATRLKAFEGHLEKMLADTSALIGYIAVSTGASPDGDTRLNERLSAARAIELSRFLTEHFSLSPNLIRMSSVGEDWEGLAEAVSLLDVPWKNQVLKIISNPTYRKDKDGRLIDERKDKLKALNRREVWNYMVRNVFPELRSSGGAVTCFIEKPSSGTRIVTDTVTIKDTVRVKEVVRDTVVVMSPPDTVYRHKRPMKDFRYKTPVFAVKTNVLAVPLLNLGVEVPVGRNWSVGADIYYPWIFRGGNMKTCNQLLAFDVEGRYYFTNPKLPKQSRLLGHSVGVYAGGGYYDVERNWSGHQGEYLNVGVDYKYSLPLFKGRINMEFEIGVGYIYSKATPYTFIADRCYTQKGVYRNVHWIGPTRAQVSVVVPIFITKDQWSGFWSGIDWSKMNFFKKIDWSKMNFFKKKK